MLMLFTTIAAVVGLSMSVPQLIRLLRTADTNGLSCSSLLNGSVNCAAWLVYMVTQQSWTPLVSTVATSLLWFALTAVAARHVYQPGAWVTPTAWAALLLASFALSTSAFTVVLSCGVIATYAPMVHTTWTAPSLSGVSMGTWLLCLVDGLAWIGIGLTANLTVALSYGLIATTCSAAVITALLVRQPRLVHTRDEVMLQPV